MSTAIANFLKSKYDNGKIPKQRFENFPTLARVPKRSDGGGDYFITSVLTGNAVAKGPTLAIAQAGYTAGSNNLNVKGAKWTIPWGAWSQVVNIEDFDLKKARSNEVAFINWLDEQIDSLHISFLESMSIQLFTETNRSLGIGTTAGTDTGVVTLTNPSDIVKFHVGDILDCAAAVDSSTIANSVALYVIAVNKNTGTITVCHTATGTAGTGAFAGASLSTSTAYYFCMRGAWGALTSPNPIFQGLGDWIPSADPASTAFNGVDRTTDIAALSGYRYAPTNLASMSLRQKITGLVTVMNSRGSCMSAGGITDVILNPEKWQVLVDELQAQGWRPLDGGAMTYGSNSIKWAIGGKTLDIVSDRHCPIGTCYALTMPKDGSNIVLCSVDEFPHIIQEDGLTMLRQSGANTYEHRLQAYPAMAVKAPGWCGRVAV